MHLSQKNPLLTGNVFLLIWHDINQINFNVVFLVVNYKNVFNNMKCSINRDPKFALALASFMLVASMHTGVFIEFYGEKQGKFRITNKKGIHLFTFEA